MISRLLMVGILSASLHLSASNSPQFERDSRGLITSCSLDGGDPIRVEYNADSKPTKVTLPDGQWREIRYNTEGAVSEVGFSNATRVEYVRDEKGRLLVRTTYQNGQPVHAVYGIYEGENLESLIDHEGNTLKIAEAEKSISPLSLVVSEFGVTLLKYSQSDDSWSFYGAMKTFGSWTGWLWNYFRQDTYLLREVNEEFEFFCKQVLGEGLVTLIGINEDPVEVGTIGAGEVSSLVRLTYINGILNTYADCIWNVSRVSKFHGEVNIHYCFRPSAGWAHDLLNAVFVLRGWTSPSAVHLAAIWKRLIAEMGGVDAGGLIIHYAHSLGSAESECARHLLTPEEQKCLFIYTIGSPSLLGGNGLAGVVNYVSYRDGVSALDTINYCYAQLYGIHYVVFLDSSTWPVVDHPLSSPTYTAILEELGQQFIDRYGRLLMAK